MQPATQDAACRTAALKLEECFNTILKENMEGIQILNHDLEVEAVEFQRWNDRILGMIVTPWFINLYLLPKDDEHWEEIKLGTKEKIQFPQKELTLMVNEIDGFGYCKSFSLYSPVKDFPNPESARIAAAIFLRDLLDESKYVEPTYSEEQIKRYLEKEDMVHQEELNDKYGDLPKGEVKEEVNRRDLIRGAIRKPCQ